MILPKDVRAMALTPESRQCLGSAENQHKGFGSKCLREIENKLLKANIQCEVKESNKAAYSFFIKNGYEEIDFDDEYKESILQKLKN